MERSGFKIEDLRFKILERLKDILRLIRWSNVLFIGVLVWVMEKWVATPLLEHAAFGEQMPGYLLWLLMAGTMLVAAGGYVVNDYFDIKIDRINRPDEVIITRTISKETAARLSWILNLAGFVCGIMAAIALRSISIGIVFIMVLLGELQTTLHDRQSDYFFFSQSDTAFGRDGEYRVAAAAVRNDSTLHHADA